MGNTIADIRRENLLRLVEEAGGNLKLAERCGVSKVYVSQVLSARIGKRLGDDATRRIEHGMKRPLGWMDHSHTGRVREERSVIWVPVLGRRWELAPLPPEQRNASITREIPMPTMIGDRPLSPRSYALEVGLDWMQSPDGSVPTHPLGSLVIVDPTRQPGNLDRVIVTVPGDPLPTLKQYYVDAGSKFLRNLNPSYPPIVMRRGMHIIGVVVATLIEQ